MIQVNPSWLERRGYMRGSKSRTSPLSPYGLAVQAHQGVLSSCSSDISARSGFRVPVGPTKPRKLEERCHDSACRARGLKTRPRRPGVDFAENARVSGSLAPLHYLQTKRTEITEEWVYDGTASGGVGSWEGVETRRRKTRTKQVKKSTDAPPSPHEENVQKTHQFIPDKASSSRTFAPSKPATTAVVLKAPENTAASGCGAS